jgi:redox-sensitive bicupin YhaK (pirin superfamily)
MEPDSTSATSPAGTAPQVIIPHTHDLGDGFLVRRALPSAQRRMVGPFVFLDHFGPVRLPPGRGMDVRPHPHTGLATVSYLMQGEIVHRDSLGVVQTIRPGEVNWMTAGRGIVHSERTGAAARAAGQQMAGLQCWVALPQAHEEDAPTFAHVGAAELPVDEGDGVRLCLIAGEFGALRSPVETLWPMVYADLQLRAGARLALPARYAEQALYVVSGALALSADGVKHPGVQDLGEHAAGHLLLLQPGAEIVIAAAGDAPAQVMLLGGEPMDGRRYLQWNFVASSAERIAQAADDWRAGRFPTVPDEQEFIPLPDLPGRPAHYP